MEGPTPSLIEEAQAAMADGRWTDAAAGFAHALELQLRSRSRLGIFP